MAVAAETPAVNESIKYGLVTYDLIKTVQHSSGKTFRRMLKLGNWEIMNLFYLQ